MKAETKYTINNAKELTAFLKEHRSNGAFIFYPSAPVGMAGTDGYEKFKDGKTKAVKFPMSIEL